VPVLVTTKAIALAQEYVAEEGLSLSFTVQFRDLEDPSLRGSPVSTFVQFIIVREA
jgi:stage V sporulation protein SpoVS